MKCLWQLYVIMIDKNKNESVFKEQNLFPRDYSKRIYTHIHTHTHARTHAHIYTHTDAPAHTSILTIQS